MRPLVPEFEARTYYDLPVLKAPVWTWEVPTYFFTGGVAAGAALLGAGGSLTGNRVLERRMHAVAFVATALSGGLLVSDLGVPSRFHHMLRVAKPTSPMSVGSWTLGAFAAAVTAAAGSAVTGRWRRVARVAGLHAAALAPVVATYTAVLIADTAVPAWHDARRTLPFLFAAGAAASAGATGVLLVPGRAGVPARRLALTGAVAELVVARRLELGLDERVAVAYRSGPAATRRTASAVTTALGSVLLAVSRGRRGREVAGAVALLAGAALERFGVFAAGRTSAADPRATARAPRDGR
jgi:hypothetical protein